MYRREKAILLWKERVERQGQGSKDGEKGCPKSRFRGSRKEGGKRGTRRNWSGRKRLNSIDENEGTTKEEGVVN